MISRTIYLIFKLSCRLLRCICIHYSETCFNIDLFGTDCDKILSDKFFANTISVTENFKHFMKSFEAFYHDIFTFGEDISLSEIAIVV